MARSATAESIPQSHSGRPDAARSSRASVAPGLGGCVDLAKREFVAFGLAEGRIKAAMNVNVWDVIDQIKPLIAGAKPVDTDRLADVPYTAL